VAIGRVIVATVEPHEVSVLQTIKEMGLELEVIFNKGSVMVLPTGVNKATGLREGLSRIGLSTRYTIGVGDAENDHAFLRICGCGIAVANALPTLKERADFVTERPHGEGVAELIDQLLANNFQPGGVKPS
jgi:hydroxymethylpyrimidine pyrophosphatase-like HAD family hydrolase